MRIVVTLLLLLAMLWGGAWLLGARMIERSTETWFAEQEAAGLLADFEALAVAGFPARMTLEIERLRLGDPRLGTGWEMPGLTVGWQARAPGTVRAVLDGGHRLFLGGEPLELDAATMAGHLRLGGRTAALQEAVLEAAELRLMALAEPGGGALERLELRASAVPDAPERLALALVLQDLALQGLDGAAATPMQRLDIAATLVLEAPLDARAAQRMPQPTALIVESGTLEWGETVGRAEGRLDIGPDGLPEGRIDLQVRGWRPLLHLAVDLGALEPGLVPTWERVLETLEQAGAESGVLSMPLVYRGGRVSLGPLPLGPAPRLRF